KLIFLCAYRSLWGIFIRHNSVDTTPVAFYFDNFIVQRNNMKYFFAVLLLLIACVNTYAQVPVREEPHHKTVLLNNYIRLIDVHLNPHDTTMYHIHATPSVIVFISRSLMGTQDMSGTGLPSGE